MAKITTTYKRAGGGMDYNAFQIMEQFFTAQEDAEAFPVLIEECRNAYTFVISSLDQFFSRDYPNGGLHDYTGRTLPKITDHLANCLMPGVTQKPDVPIITMPYAEEFIRRIASLTDPRDPNARKEWSLQAFAALLHQVQRVWRINNDPKLPALPPNLLAEFNSYGMWKNIEESKRSADDVFGVQSLGERQTTLFNDQVNSLLEEQRTNIAALAAAVDTQRERLQTDHQRNEVETETIRQKLESMNEALDRSSGKLVEVVNIISTTDQNIAAFSEAVREELKIDATKKLWEQRAKDNRLAFWISAGLIAFVIVAPALLVLCNPEAIVHFLERITQAATPGLLDSATTAQLTAATISKIVIISAPLAVYFWAIKLIVRFNTRCMVLMDDARQRHTTMDTYFHLIEKDGATTEERGLMLNALFRPLAGQGQDNVEPPNFIELIGKGKD
ncbi:DUF6161 domain-containing protein [Agrobacterium sp. Azo12]|uniref:DUF6161 domain-containing protein n=1 Tax=Agrobacterium sp. Azo12 TaxID=3031129 RepID=UPI0023D88E86|nr:DUF6161 domain-containing protein [Agrobacterium sp. Azo12]MDO5895106.1 DUF6161 domain-containing protein [Agrobacterium sp. Azo12]